MGVIEQKNAIERNEIKQFLKKHLSTVLFDKNMVEQIILLLQTKGKIFNSEIEDKSFSWSQFFLHVSSLLTNEETCKKSLIANAAAIELLILATDIVDEIVDNDDDLMKSMTLAEAITISNALLIDSLDLILKYNPHQIHEVILNIFKQLKTACNGQWLDLKLTVSNKMPSEEDYFRVIEQKSASLIKLVCSISYPSEPQLFLNIAKNIGIAGQLINDANDIFLDSKSDLIKRKATLPVIKAVEYSIENDNGWLLKKFSELEFAQEDQKLKEDIRHYIKNSGAIEYCNILSKLFLKKAIEELTKLFPTKPKEINTLINHIKG